MSKGAGSHPPWSRDASTLRVERNLKSPRDTERAPHVQYQGCGISAPRAERNRATFITLSMYSCPCGRGRREKVPPPTRDVQTDLRVQTANSRFRCRKMLHCVQQQDRQQGGDSLAKCLLADDWCGLPSHPNVGYVHDAGHAVVEVPQTILMKDPGKHCDSGCKVAALAS